MKSGISPVDEIAIVLTGTIVPNVSILTKQIDWQHRRQEYLNSICFYKDFAPVYFLENSSYDLLGDPEFANMPNVSIRKLPMSNFSDRGKGFQEFEMLDRWLSTEQALPVQWLKVTGRYIYPNISAILAECHADRLSSMIINRYKFTQLADVALFYIRSEYYLEHILELYQKCDDRHKQSWIEKVMFLHLDRSSNDKLKIFKTPSNCIGISGTDGQNLQRRSIDRLNAAIRSINYQFDRKYIWLSL
jgi:hypothetical protein